MTKITRVKKPKKSEELYVTQKQLDLMVQAINNRTTTLHLELRADIKAMDTRISQILVLVEEQNNRNRFVLDGYTQIYNKLIEHDERFEKIDRRFEQIDKRFEQIDHRLDKMDQRFDGMDQRFDRMDQRFDRLESRFSVNEFELQGIKKHILEH